MVWGAIIKGVVSLAPTVIGMFKKKKDNKAGVENTETDGEVGKKGGIWTTLAGALAGGVGSLFKSKKEGNNGFVSSLGDNPLINTLITAISTIVNATKKDDKGGDVSGIDKARDVLANARNNSQTDMGRISDRLDRMENILANGGPQPNWGGVNMGFPPPQPMRFAPPRPVAFHRPPVHNRPPVFRTARMPRGHAVTRIMPNNFGRMV